MPRLVAILALLCAFLLLVAGDETRRKLITLQLTDDDVVSGGDLTKANSNEEPIGFIGDLIVGQRHADETIYRRVVQISNRDPFVSFFALEISAKRGAVHYLSVVNNPDSYAVVCDTPHTLGATVSRFVVRVLPRTESVLSVFVATHPA